MIFYLPRKGAGVTEMCACNKGKDGSQTSFTVRTADGKTQTVRSEQEARALVRIQGGSYSKT